MGTRDLVKPVLAELGTVHFGRVAVKPGKPLTLATIEGAIVFGLPGFPVSSLVSFESFVRPALRMMMGHRALWRPEVTARLRHDVRHRPDRTEFQRAVIRQEDDATWWATTTGSQVSSRLKSLVGANALLRIPRGVGNLAAGDTVTALRIDLPEEQPA
jgi:molybdopterin biosynthesis enzyme